MKAIKIIGYMSAFGVLLCATGYDCPECNFTAQTIALVSCLTLSILCGLIAGKE